MEEIDEVKILKKQVKELKLALAEETLSRQIEQATVQIAAGIIGISAEELKKKLAQYRACDGFNCRKGSSF
jgi:capsular polysaccharide biosynthesis protein